GRHLVDRDSALAVGGRLRLDAGTRDRSWTVAAIGAAGDPVRDRERVDRGREELLREAPLDGLRRGQARVGRRAGQVHDHGVQLAPRQRGRADLPEVEPETDEVGLERPPAVVILERVEERVELVEAQAVDGPDELVETTRETSRSCPSGASS